MSLSKRKRWEILQRDDFTCRYCGQRAPDVVVEVDHVDPVSLGGSDEDTNLATACYACNRGKRDEPLMPSWSDEAANQYGRARRWAFLWVLRYPYLDTGVTEGELYAVMRADPRLVFGLVGFGRMGPLPTFSFLVSACRADTASRKEATA